ncbi:MAG: diacylglycerol kinase [Rhodococcus sp. (in: high G+C Gram-positive bacteria)]
MNEQPATTSVVLWGTGNVGALALAGIIDNPALELVGVCVSTEQKNGVDAGVLAGIDREVGILATTDVEAILGLGAQCVVYTAMTDNRLPDALEDIRRILAAGINVAASAPVFLQYPFDVLPAEMIEPLTSAAREGNSSLWVNGIDPGFANDLLPLALTGTCRSIEQVRCMEIIDYSTYDNALVLFDIMGFGKPMNHTPMLLQPGVLSLAWGSVVRQLAVGLGVTLDEVTEHHERLSAPDTFDVTSGSVPEGTAAALRFEVRGMIGDRAVVVLEHVTRMRADLAPAWPQPARGDGSYRVEITGEPSYDLDLVPHSKIGDHNHAALVGTAMRIVNAVPAVVQARTGILSVLDLPLITGAGMVRPAD